MAVMSRAKQTKGRSWAQKNESKTGESYQAEKKEVSEDEHNERLEMLKKLGLIKE